MIVKLVIDIYESDPTFAYPEQFHSILKEMTSGIGNKENSNKVIAIVL